MPTITAAAGGGNWNVGATWVGGVAPTAADDVLLTAASGNVTIPAATTVACRSLDCTGYVGTLTFAATTSILNVGDAGGGALKFVAGMTLTLTGLGFINLVSTSNNGGTGWALTTAGKSMPNLTVNGLGGKWVLQDAFTSPAGTVLLTAGALDTNGMTVSTNVFNATGTSVKVLTLGATVWTVANAWSVTGSALTLNPGTSLIRSAGNISFSGNGLVYNDLDLPSAGTITINGANTFRNLTRTGTASNTDALTLSANQIVTGTLTFASNSLVNRLLIQSTAVGTPRTITAAVLAATNVVDFMDIVGAGAATWTTAGSGATAFGDAGGNSGITFTASVTQTYSGGAGNWSDVTKWTSRVPLPQDDVVVGVLATGTVTADMPRLGRNINFTGFVNAYNQSVVSPWFFGSWTNGSGMMISGTNSHTALGRSSHTIATNGVALPFSLTIVAVTGTYTLGSAFMSSRSASSALSLTSGTFDSAGFSVIFAGLLGGATFNGGTLTMGASVWTFAGTGAIWTMAAGVTLSAAASTIVLSGASATSRTFAGGGKSYGELRYTVADSPGALVITGANTFAILNIGPGRTVTLPSGSPTTVTNLTVDGDDFDYLYLPGVAGSYISTPFAADLDIAGDIDIRIRDALTDWTPGTDNALISQNSSAAGAGGWYLQASTSGFLRFFWTEIGGTQRNVFSSVGVPAVDGTPLAVRVTLDVDNGAGGHVVTFYTSPTGADGTWVPLGVPVNAGAFVTSFVSPHVELRLGTYRANATGLETTGRVYWAQVRNGINGAVVAEYNAAAHVPTSDTYTGPTGKVWTLVGLATVGLGRVAVNGSAPGTAATIVRPWADAYGNTWTPLSGAVVADGTGITSPHITAPDSAAVSIVNDLDVRARVTLDDWTPATEQRPWTKWDNAPNNEWMLAVGAPNGRIILYLSTTGSDSPSASSTVSPVVADGATLWIRATRVRATGLVTFYTADGALTNPGPADWVQLGATAVLNAGVAIPATTASLRVGRSATSAAISGKGMRAVLLDGINGNVVADADLASGLMVAGAEYVTVTDVPHLSDKRRIAYDSVVSANSTGWVATDRIASTDVANMTVTEASATTAQFAAADAANLAVTEAAPTIAATLARSDAANLTVTEADTLAAFVATVDDVFLSIDDTAGTIAGQLAAADAANLAVTEATSGAVVASASDTVDLAVDDVGLREWLLTMGCMDSSAALLYRMAVTLTSCEGVPVDEAPEVGSVVRVNVAVTSEATGLPVDPTFLHLLVERPDRTTYTPDPIVHTGVGTYYADVIVTAAGQWTWRWWSEGIGQAAKRGAFLVPRQTVGV